jgi:glycosyltransferase involved in cell wall biosynthesis
LKRQQNSRVAVVNFNAPELHQLAAALSAADMLHVNCRMYANKGRRWERLIETLPFIGKSYGRTFGRRRLTDPGLSERTVELSVAADWAAALVARASVLPSATRELWKDRLYEKMREGIANGSVKHVTGATHVVAYPGCGHKAFRRLSREGGAAVLSYPIAHHAYHLRLRNEEAERQPEFADSWRVFENSEKEYLEILDTECRSADRILVGSSFVSDTFVSEGLDRDKIEVIPYGVDTQLFAMPERASPREELSILFVGQISQRKGLSYLFEAYDGFRRPGTSLTLVGRYVGPAERWARYRSLYTHIDHLPRAALADVYGRSDVFVFPSLLEGMPLVVLEAMASGLPVIVTPNGCSDIVRDGVDGFVVPIRDPEAIRHKLELLSADADLRRRMGESARERALTYTWPRYTAAVMQSIARM